MKKTISLTKIFMREIFQNMNLLNKEKKKLNKKSIFFWLFMIVLVGVTYVTYELITFFVKIRTTRDIFEFIFFSFSGIIIISNFINIC